MSEQISTVADGLNRRVERCLVSGYVVAIVADELISESRLSCGDHEFVRVPKSSAVYLARLCEQLLGPKAEGISRLEKLEVI